MSDTTISSASNGKHYDGVFSATRKNGEAYYRASLTYKRKHISLGSYKDPQTAHRAYLEGNLLLTDASMTLFQYTDDSLLSFDKWVSLINFRDNQIYFSTPIYVGQKMIYYYLSPSHVLKFDMDDLFFYASHKIMCRGTHYFVADYGMQINLASRYNIKNYAVLGKDYRFRNNDRTDFRRENIEILNTYHGVSIIQTGVTTKYVARIHIRGNYLIGKFDTEIEAAIAYNKAIDILKKNGVSKQFVPNYIDCIPASRYADIYSAITIPQKIISYRP